MLLIAGCGTGSSGNGRCASCHRGLEPVSPSHPSCVSCHGGDPAEKDGKKAHAGMRGPGNPSGPRFWEKSCGPCHPYQLQRVRSTIMATNTGMIRNIQLTWEGEDGKAYAVTGGTLPGAAGERRKLLPVAELDNLSGELYRKFCSRCHVGAENGESFSASHGAGCAACHFPFNDTATYAGGDRAMRGKSPYSASHRLEPLPDNGVCLRCHSRSGRIAFSYQGLYDGNNGLVPTKNGLPGPVMASGDRNLTHIAPDIHFSAGMDCIDCHTSRDVMGDGYYYRNMYLQTEVRCEDCHGSPSVPPRHRPVSRENDAVLRESRSYRQQMRPGMEMVLTSRGLPYSNVWYQGGRVWLLGKRSGKLLP
ncbi:MAG TPA: cytochrome c3 family protein, partial [Desulfuromonadaceae bacterium]